MAKKPRTPAPPRPVQAPKRRDEPKRRVPARPTPRGATRVSTGGVPRFWLVAAGAVALIAIVAVVAIVALGGKSGGGGGVKPIDWSALPGLIEKPPPWGNNNATLPGRLAPLGLEQLGAEGQVIHVHQYLYLYINGKRVTAPPLIGIYANEWLTQLHTHIGEPNIIHLESPTKREYSLGEFFGVWGVKLTQDCVGPYCDVGKLHWWLDGKPQTGDPANLLLKDHEVITIAYGKPPAKIPSTFDFKGYGL
jgi:hypothetical protein